MNVTTGTDPLDFRTAEASARRPADWRTALDANALQGKRLGYYAAAFQDPFGTTETRDALLATFAGFTAAGATIVEIPAPPAAPPGVPGNRGYEGWQRWLDDHPESPYDSPRQIITSPKRLPYSRQATTRRGPMTPSEVDGWIAFRTEYKQRLGDWMDANDVDAVIYPGILSDVNLNDGIANSFGRLDPQSSASGVPSVILPAGVNDHGEPMNLQLMGRAWDDAKLVGFAYAFDLKANATWRPRRRRSCPTRPASRRSRSSSSGPRCRSRARRRRSRARTPACPRRRSRRPRRRRRPRACALMNTAARADRRGRFTVVLACAGTGTCRARVTVRRSGRVVARRSASMKAGARLRLRFTTAGSVRRSLARGSRLRFAIVLAPQAGTRVTRATQALVVRGART